MNATIAGLVGKFEEGRLSRRELIQSLSALVAAASASRVADAQAPQRFPVTGVQHISFQVADYARTRDFYSGLLNLRVSNDDPRQKEVQLNYRDGFILARTARQIRTAPRVDHFAFGIANWDKPRVQAELKQRGLQFRPDAQLPNDSFHIVDPDGYDLQLVNDKAGR